MARAWLALALWSAGLACAPGALTAAAPRQPPPATWTFPPRDESHARADLRVFLATIRDAVARRDVDTLVRLAADDIQLGFGTGAPGRQAFKKSLDAGELWQPLTEVLALGGTFPPGMDDVFSLPYVSSAWPAGLDGFVHVAILGRNVRVRARPHAAAGVLTTLSHRIVPLADGGPGNDMDRWAAIRLDDGRVGFVARQFVRSPVDYRLVCVRTDGQWRMASFLAGD
jgi:hypothetical protein